MNSNVAALSLVKVGKVRHLVAITCGCVLAISGCSIPGLRGARPGPAMPPSYNWYNGAGLERPGVPPAPAAESTESELRSVSVELDSSRDGDAADATNAHIHPQPDETAAQTSGPDDLGSPADLIEPPSIVALSTPAGSEDETNTTSTEIHTPDPQPATEPERLNAADTAVEGAASVSPDAETVGVAHLENSAQLPVSTFFADPDLVDLVNQALVGNQELRMLAEEIQIAYNESYARSGEYRPFVNLGGAAGVEKHGRHTLLGAVEEELEAAPGKEFPDPLPDFLAAAEVSWELDIWKKLRNAQNAAAMRYLGTQEGRRYVVTRLVAEIADNYYELLALDNQLSTLDRTIEIQEHSLQVAIAKKDAGRGTELAVQRFQAEVQKNQSQRSIIAQRIVEVENRINFLVGRYPQPVQRIATEYIDLNLNTLSAGVPSQLLQNRADIRQAEREVAAAGLDVKVARARFYPSLTLTGDLGWHAFSTGYLFRTPESLIYGIAAELVGPLINKRAIQAAYSSANAAQLQSIYNYQQTILKAHIEVVNYISKVENLRRSIEVKKEQYESLQAAVNVANQLFQNARAEYVEVLLAQREMMEARMQLIELKQQQLGAIVNAYQALGGGGF